VQVVQVVQVVLWWSVLVELGVHVVLVELGVMVELWWVVLGARRR
jgi:hypothetical protein